MNRLLHIVSLQQMVANNYCDPNFSILAIAEACHDYNSFKYFHTVYPPKNRKLQL